MHIRVLQPIVGLVFSPRTTGAERPNLLAALIAMEQTVAAANDADGEAPDGSVGSLVSKETGAFAELAFVGDGIVDSDRSCGSSTTATTKPAPHRNKTK